MHFTVAQVVKVCANRFGGRHYHKSEQDDHETSMLRHLDSHFRVGGASGALSSLRLIGEITLEALQELNKFASDPIAPFIDRTKPEYPKY